MQKNKTHFAVRNYVQNEFLEKLKQEKETVKRHEQVLNYNRGETKNKGNFQFSFFTIKTGGKGIGQQYSFSHPKNGKILLKHTHTHADAHTHRTECERN